MTPIAPPQVAVLLGYKGSMSIRDARGVLPLVAAAEAGDEAVFGMLLAHGALDDAGDEDMGLIFDTVEQNNNSKIVELLEQAADPSGELPPPPELPPLASGWAERAPTATRARPQPSSAASTDSALQVAQLGARHHCLMLLPLGRRGHL